MSAEVLRQAAALMRERAEGATAGPWQTYVDPNDDPIVFDQYGTGVQSSSTFDVICYSGQIYSRDATHIASWHPAVALAVADQLEAMAAVVAEAVGSPLAIVAEGLAEKSVAVARAYLGSDQ